MVGLNRPGEAVCLFLLSASLVEKCTLVAKTQGAALMRFKFLVSKKMRTSLVDKGQMMPKDQCQHASAEPTCRRRHPCKAASDRLLGTNNPELLHAELKGRTFHSEPDGRAVRSAEDPIGVIENG